jgi:hypothetical protein
VKARTAVRCLVLLASVVVLGGASAWPAWGASGTRSRQLWSALYDGPGHGDDLALDAAVSPDGSRVFVTGYSQGFGGLDWATFAYDADTGAVVWTQRYDGPDHLDDRASDLAVSPDGS